VSKIFDIRSWKMAFREKSAWAMALITGIAGLWYLNTLIALAAEAGMVPAPLGLLVRYVIVIVVASIVAQVILAVITPTEAEAPADERERLVYDRAGSQAGDVLTFGLLVSLGWFLIERDGNLLFHMAFLSLLLAQTMQHLLLAVRLRRGA
jgi:hypothetical protein